MFNQVRYLIHVECNFHSQGRALVISLAAWKLGSVGDLDAVRLSASAAPYGFRESGGEH